MCSASLIWLVFIINTESCNLAISNYYLGHRVDMYIVCVIIASTRSAVKLLTQYSMTSARLLRFVLGESACHWKSWGVLKTAEVLSGLWKSKSFTLTLFFHCQAQTIESPPQGVHSPQSNNTEASLRADWPALMMSHKAWRGRHELNCRRTFSSHTALRTKRGRAWPTPHSLW